MMVLELSDIPKQKRGVTNVTRINDDSTIPRYSTVCACTCHRTDVEDEKYHAICMSCNCAFEFINLYKVSKEKESRQRKRKV